MNRLIGRWAVALVTLTATALPVQAFDSRGITRPHEIASVTTTPTWSSWESFHGMLGSPPVATVTGPGVTDTFVQGTDLNIWDHSSNGTSSQWVEIGAQTTLAPGAATLATRPGWIDLAERNLHGDLFWTECQTGGSCSSWNKFPGGRLAAEPSVVMWPNEEHVFVEGTDHHLYEWMYGGPNNPPFTGQWGPLGGVLASAPVAVAVGSNDVVFVRGADQHLWYWTSGTNTVSGGQWTDAGGLLADRPAAVSTGDAFARGIDGALWHFSIPNARWEPVGGRMMGFPSAVAGGGSGDFEVFVEGTDRALWHARLAAGYLTWQWEPLSGRLDGSPSAVMWFTNIGPRVDVFARGADGALWHRSIQYPGMA